MQQTKETPGYFVKFVLDEQIQIGFISVLMAENAEYVRYFPAGRAWIFKEGQRNI